MSVMTPTRQIVKEPISTRASAPAVKRYQVAFYETPFAAKADIEKLKALRAQCDELNIVIRAEPPFDDQDLAAIGKVFAGAAWALIHERRRQDGWYDAPQE